MGRLVRRIFKCLVLPASVLLITQGCAGVMPAIKSPRVTISDLRVQQVNPLETTFQVQLRIINPNDFPLTIKGLECDLELNDQHFGSGVSGKGATIPAFGTDVVSVSVYSSMIDLIRGFLKVPEREQLSYRIKGSVTVAAGGSPATSVPFETHGELDLTDPERSL